jgi:hypothetical protein
MSAKREKQRYICSNVDEICESVRVQEVGLMERPSTQRTCFDAFGTGQSLLNDIGAARGSAAFRVFVMVKTPKKLLFRLF